MHIIKHGKKIKTPITVYPLTMPTGEQNIPLEIKFPVKTSLTIQSNEIKVSKTLWSGKQCNKVVKALLLQKQVSFAAMLYKLRIWFGQLRELMLLFTLLG